MNKLIDNTGTINYPTEIQPEPQYTRLELFLFFLREALCWAGLPFIVLAGLWIAYAFLFGTLGFQFR